MKTLTFQHKLLICIPQATSINNYLWTVSEVKKISDFKRKLPIKGANEGFSLEHGKMPPQALDLEEAVLGAVLLEKDAVNAVIDILQPVSFYKDAHQRIYEAIRHLFGKSEPIDILTVTNQLKSSGELDLVGGAYYIAKLTNRVASSANIEYHARIIAQKYIQRELISISSEIINDAYDETTDVFTLMDKAESKLFSVAEGNIRKNYDDMSSLIVRAIKQIESVRTQDGGVVGVESGFHALDDITSGWQASDLIIIAGRPAMGKTAFAMTLARNASVDFGKSVAIFSCEMSSLQLVTRLISSESEISSEKLRSGKLESHEMEQIHSKIRGLAEAKLFIDDTPALSIFELRAKARRLMAQHQISMIIIDYLQLMTVGSDVRGGNREQEISAISRSLKSIAKELEIPIIALSQLSRSVETRGGDKKPQLSDLRESGAIEQDADMVIFLHRPEYYGLTEDGDGNSTVGVANVIISKHRNGKVGEVQLKFVQNLAKFGNLDRGDYSGFGMDQFGKLPENREFDSGTMTYQSKLNDDDDDPDDTPF